MDPPPEPTLTAIQAVGFLLQAGGVVVLCGGAAVEAALLYTENTGVVCFTRGTLIETALGDVAIEMLQVGDLVLTKDESLIDMSYEIGWSIRDPEQFLFQIDKPETTVQEVAESAIREIVGRSQLDFVLEQGRQDMNAVRTKIERAGAELKNLKTKAEVAAEKATKTTG